MHSQNFKSYLSSLGYSKNDFEKSLKNNDTFFYNLKQSKKVNQIIPPVIYFHFKNEDILFKKHLELWNENYQTAFVAVTDNKSYLINAKQKPNDDHPLQRGIVISSFNYGINSAGYEKEKIYPILKEGIDSAYYFDFIAKNLKSTNEVDKDLLLNLISLKNNLENNKNKDKVHLLILRCLFLKYLEDRGIYDKDNLAKILKTQSPSKLLESFNEINKINGDLFHANEISINDIKSGNIEELYRFFTEDYRTGQLSLFPYQFDKIPIQLISNVYEAFLKSDERKNNGVYYTPDFIVKFMLSQTFGEKLKKKKNATILDPACGSGSFLVEAFKMIINSYSKHPSYEKKKEILEAQILGIDLDHKALQISAFSLYLTLLDNEDSEFIKNEIKNRHPILPTLIGKTLIHANSLVDDITFFKSDTNKELDIDCVSTNPPWGSINSGNNNENLKTRDAIGSKGKEGANPLYKNVSDYQRSQAFLLRLQYWGDKNTVYCTIVNNSIFLNENAIDFRKDLLENYTLKCFYELSQLNKILFKKRGIGKVSNKIIYMGANEPAAVLIFNKNHKNENNIKYITPYLTDFSETFRIIHYDHNSVKKVQQIDLLKEDILWRIFVHGNWDVYQLIKKVSFNENKIQIECSSGFQPQKSTVSLGQPSYKNLIDQKDFTRYQISSKLEKFNWNQKLRRKPKYSIFKGKRILLACEPFQSDGLKIRGIRTEREMVFKHSILSVTIYINSQPIKDYAPYLAIFNSSLAGFYLYQISSQWGKGKTRNTLRNKDIESFPMPKINASDIRIKKLTSLVNRIETEKKQGNNVSNLENEIDEIVFDLYDLLDYEKEIIREFYDVNVNRKDDIVKELDLQKYAEKFREVFQFVLEDSLSLKCEYYTSNVGTAVLFTIINSNNLNEKNKKRRIDLLHVVKRNQLQKTYLSRILNEDKIKIYEENSFYIIKGKYYKDWTIWQAIKDANEEIEKIVRAMSSI